MYAMYAVYGRVCANKAVGVGQNKRCCLRAQKRMTGVRYGLRAEKLWWRITNERRPRSEVREEERPGGSSR